MGQRRSLFQKLRKVAKSAGSIEAAQWKLRKCKPVKPTKQPRFPVPEGHIKQHKVISNAQPG